MGQKKKRKRRKKAKGRSLADRADRHVCYQKSVQSPEADLEFFSKRFRERRGREPQSLREDFCGTAFLSSVWINGDSDRTALCVDIDSETLEWGRQHNFSGPLVTRASFRCDDVRNIRSPAVDVACAMNFSFCVFKERPDLLRYFETVQQGLTDDGVFFCELYGGTEAIVEIEETRAVEDFTFIWNQAEFNPITNETLCHIHFEFKDGSRLDKAFTYDWRLWSIPEVKELLEAAGFASVDVYWEAVDEDGDGTGEHRLTTREENQEGWLVLIVATK
jgi:SAM-dependent methyltransferase